jgi:tellurite resistance protein
VVPVLIALLGAAVALCFFVYRARNAGQVAADVLDMANDVRLAARRFGFRRQANVHPVESIEDANVAITAAALAFLELDDLPTQEQRARLVEAARHEFGLAQADAEEMQVLGRWLAAECGSPSAAVSRLARKLYKLRGQDAFEPLLRVIQAVASTDGLSERQRDALEDVRLAFRIR